MRFLHTSDWHIGLKAAHAGPAAPRLREERYAAARRIAALAREHNAGFVLIAGDLFDSHAPAPADIRETAALLGGFPAPVYLIPGNHDPHVPGGPWEHPVWREFSNVHCLLDPCPLPLEGATLYPCPLRSRWHGGDPLGWIPPREAAHGVRIGLAHGGLDTAGGPVPADAAARYGLDYLALGDWHSVSPNLDAGPRQAYSGTPEPDAFNLRDAGYVLLVEIAAPGALPAVTPLRSGRLFWRQDAAELLQEGDARRLRQRLEEEASGDVLLDLAVSGELFPGDERELDEIAALLQQRYFHGRLTRGALWPAGAEAELPPGPLAMAAAQLRERAAAGDHAAADALLLLRRLSLEAGL